jgi:hypothetical protein
MVIQFLGHRNDGCLDWFDTVTCTPTTPTCSTPTPTPITECTKCRVCDTKFGIL